MNYINLIGKHIDLQGMKYICCDWSKDTMECNGFCDNSSTTICDNRIEQHFDLYKGKEVIGIKWSSSDKNEHYIFLVDELIKNGRIKQLDYEIY